MLPTWFGITAPIPQNWFAKGEILTEGECIGGIRFQRTQLSVSQMEATVLGYFWGSTCYQGKLKQFWNIDQTPKKKVFSDSCLYRNIRTLISTNLAAQQPVSRKLHLRKSRLSLRDWFLYTLRNLITWNIFPFI